MCFFSFLPFAGRQQSLFEFIVSAFSLGRSRARESITQSHSRFQSNLFVFYTIGGKWFRACPRARSLTAIARRPNNKSIAIHFRLLLHRVIFIPMYVCASVCVNQKRSVCFVRCAKWWKVAMNKASCYVISNLGNSSLPMQKGKFFHSPNIYDCVQGAM